ncbi:hypothetical protein CLOM621_05493 [Clostridium sp. M62/1]|nr:hypothetical protein CLOM621_05493 [Clostridium sp. M62/1]
MHMSQTRLADSAPEHKSGQKKRDLLLLAVLLAAAALLFAGREFFAGRPAVMVSVSVDGTEIMTLDLNRNDDIVIESGNGQTNHLIIEDGKAFLTEASCPDKLCVRQGAISETGQSIVCLPNRVIVTIVGTK